MTLILALLVLFGLGKVIETVAANTAVAGCYAHTYVAPKGFRGYYPGAVYFCTSSISQLKLNWGLILRIAVVLTAYHISSSEEIGGLAGMTLLTTEAPRKDPVKIWNLIVLSAHPTFFAKPTASASTKAIANKAMWLQQLLDIPPSEGNWNLIMTVKDADSGKVMRWDLKPADIGWKDTMSVGGVNVNGHWTPLREFLQDIQKMGVFWTISGVTGLISPINHQFKGTNGERTTINGKTGYKTLALVDQPNVRIAWDSGREDKLDIQESHLYSGRTREAREPHLGGNTCAIVRINSGIVKTAGRPTDEPVDILPDLVGDLGV